MPVNGTTGFSTCKEADYSYFCLLHFIYIVNLTSTNERDRMKSTWMGRGADIIFNHINTYTLSEGNSFLKIHIF